MVNVPARRLRIAYLVGTFPAPSETFIVNQIVGVAARGHDVDIYTTCMPTDDPIPVAVARSGLLQRRQRLCASPNRLVGLLETVGLALVVGMRAPRYLLRVLRLVMKTGRAGSLRLLYAALRLHRLGSKRYDVIHAQFGVYGSFASRLIEVGAISGALVTSFRGYDVGKRAWQEHAGYRELFNAGALFFPVSAALATRLVKAGCDPAKVQVHHSGIRVRDLPYAERRSTANVVHAVTVARLVEKKGLLYAIEAVALVRASGRAISYTIIGDGPLRDELTQLTQRYGIKAHVQLRGWLPHEQALQCLQTAHVLLAPSVTAIDGDEEGIPNAVKEAMAFGVPVISTVHGGIPELVEDGVSGFLVPERDVIQLSERLITLIDHPQLGVVMGRAARARVEREYDSERLNEELIALYSAVAANSSALVPVSAPTTVVTADIAGAT
ncbi:MAG: glycosyltransferase [Gammaproteobacteria bacterium]|nr:glycosyltransferase [Gammaproteobacteria bacterium]